MAKIPINGLQDLLMLRQMREQADPFRQGLRALAAGVSQGLEAGRAEQKAKKALAEEKAAFLELARGKEGNTNSNVITKISFDPKSGLSTKMSIPTEKEKLDRQKLELEIGDLQFEEKTRLGTGGTIDIPDTDLSIPRRKPISGTIQRSGGLVIPEFGASGKAKKIVDIPASQAIARAEQEVATEGQVESQQQKAAAKTETDLFNARLKIDNTLDSFLDTAERTMDLTGVGPGILGGSLSRILGPTKYNEFYDGFKGGLIEFAAAAGRISIPGSRAARLVNIFKKTAPTEFSTIESAVQTSADSFRNGLASDMANSPEEYVFQNLSPKEGRKVWDGLSKDQKLTMTEQLSEQLREWEEAFKQGALETIYKRNPNLLQQDTRLRFDELFSSDSSTLSELGLNPDEFEIVR